MAPFALELRRALIVAAMIAAPWSASPSFGGELTPDELFKEVRRMAERLEKLEQRNAELERKLRATMTDSDPQLARRVKTLEERNARLEVSLSDDHIRETDPELVTRLKAVEFQTLGMQKQARTVAALEGVAAGVSFTSVAQRTNRSSTIDNTAESQFNYRTDVSVSLPAGTIGDAESKIFGHFRLGQGTGLSSLISTFSGPNTSAFQLRGVTQPADSAVMLAQAWYQADIPLPLGGFKPSSRERLTINFGKMDPFVFFDQNAAANDETRQFLNNVFVHNALLDAGRNIGVDAYGFSPGLRIAYQNETQKPLTYGLSLGVFGAGPGAGFVKSFDAPFVIVQAETQQKFFGGLTGNYRLYLWRNPQAPAYDNSLRSHHGVGASIDQRVGDATTLFARFGRQFGARSQFDRSLALGAELSGSYWQRGADSVGIAFGAQRVSADFGNDSLTLDANGDGVPDFGYAAAGAEKVLELYYRYRINKQFELSPDLQLVARPAGNGTMPTLKMLGLRAQVTF